jgi:hypothetical protein
VPPTASDLRRAGDVGERVGVEQHEVGDLAARHRA